MAILEDGTVERPILFNTEMVRAVLVGEKTQTRRIIKSPAKNMQESGSEVIKRNPDNDPWYKDRIWSMRMKGGVWGDYTHQEFLKFCPYGKPGDRLWVRETWALKTGCQYDHHSSVFYKSDKTQKLIYWQHGHKVAEKYGLNLKQTKLRPSIFMPRWASRINLLIKDVRIERIQDISREDSAAEGICHLSDIGFEGKFEGVNIVQKHNWPEENFSRLWDSINKKRGYGWNLNPWVWVVEFERINDRPK